MTPQQRAENIARTYLNPLYGHGDAIEAIRVAQIENANVELEKRREAENLIERMKRCTMCAGDPPDQPDKDCICGGAQTRQSQMNGMSACIQHWRKKSEEYRKECLDALEKFSLVDQRERVAAIGKDLAEKALADHLAHVQRFLQEMYAVMVDPLEYAPGKVEDTCKTLLEAAKRDREAANEHGNLITLVQRLLDDVASLERTYAGSLWTTGAGYTLHPRVLELRQAVRKENPSTDYLEVKP